MWNDLFSPIRDLRNIPMAPSSVNITLIDGDTYPAWRIRQAPD
jgi:hypothetical protein